MITSGAAPVACRNVDTAAKSWLIGRYFGLYNLPSLSSVGCQLKFLAHKDFKSQMLFAYFKFLVIDVLYIFIRQFYVSRSADFQNSWCCTLNTQCIVLGHID